MGHVEDLLVAAREGELPPEDAVREKEHVAGCARCARFERALGRGQAALRRSVPDLALPELRPRARAGGLTHRALAAVASVAVLVVALGVGLSLNQLRSGDPSSGQQRALGFLDLFALGGGALILMDESGRELRRVPLGLVARLDPNDPPRGVLHVRTGRVAIWRDRPQEPLAELLVWDGRELRVLATITERPAWTIWSADGGTLYFNAYSRDWVRASLLAADLRTGQVRTVQEHHNGGAIDPVFATDAFVAGVTTRGRGSVREYVVAAADTGRPLRTWEANERFGGLLPQTDVDARLVAVSMRESSLETPNALRIWRADDYSDHWVLAWDQIRSFQFVPGRGELIVSGRRQASGPYEIAAVDRSGRTRVLLTDDRELGVVLVSPDGRAVLVYRQGRHTEGGYLYDARTYELKADGLTERGGLISGERRFRIGPPGPPAMMTARRSDDVAAIGWVAFR